MKRIIILCLIALGAARGYAQELEQAVKNNDAAKVQSLLASGASPDVKDSAGTPLIIQVAFTPSLLRSFLAAKADVNVSAYGVITPLSNAAGMGCIACVDMLIDAGAKPDIHALNAAGTAACAPCATSLIKAGADVNGKGAMDNTPLHSASGALPPVKMAANTKFLVDMLEKGGYGAITPDKYAQPSPDKFGKPEDVVKVLLDHGAKIDVKNQLGLYPLHLAAEKDNGKVVELLLGKGAKMKDKDASGNTPWMSAVTYASGNAMTAFIKSGEMKVDEKFQWHDYQTGIDMEEMTALSVAAARGEAETIQQLLDLGASPRATSSGKFMVNGCFAQVKGKTPFIYAIESGKMENVRVFMENVKKYSLWSDWPKYDVKPTTPCKMAGFSKAAPWKNIHIWSYARELGHEEIAHYLEKEFDPFTVGKN